jgi:BASS family bile acid:Na+ symporter
VDLAIQACVFVIMTIVGLDLTREDFVRLLERPALVIAASVAQWVALPLIAWAIIIALPLPPHIVAGTVLLAACPAGAISNYYAHIARADVALSVTLTPISTAAAIFKMPLITAVGYRLFFEGSSVSAPAGPIALQVLLFLLLPVISGMWLRSSFPKAVARHTLTARRIGDTALFLTVAFLLFKLRQYAIDGIWWTILVAGLFVIAAAATGLAVGAALGAGRRQRTTLAIEFACRNNALIALVALVVLDRPDLAAFGLVVFLAQIPLVLGGVIVTTGFGRPASSKPAPTP